MGTRVGHTLMSTHWMARAATDWRREGVGVEGGLRLSEAASLSAAALLPAPTLSQLLDLYTATPPTPPPPVTCCCFFFLRDLGVFLALDEGHFLSLAAESLSSYTFS